MFYKFIETQPFIYKKAQLSLGKTDRIYFI